MKGTYHLWGMGMDMVIDMDMHMQRQHDSVTDEGGQGRHMRRSAACARGQPDI